MDRQLLKDLNSARATRQAAVVVTSLSDGTGHLVTPDSPIGGGLQQSVSKVFRTGKAETVAKDATEYFLNPYLPTPRIVVIGAVHISQVLADIAKTAGFSIEIIDPRTAFATEARFGDTPLFADWPEEVLVTRPLDPYCALVAVTHDPKIDDLPLAAALRNGCFYVGALGSRKTHGKRLDRLRNKGVSDASLATIKSPIGLDIGAANPQEIAVSIMAEIIDTYRKCNLESYR